MKWTDYPHYDDALRDIIAESTTESPWDLIASKMDNAMNLPQGSFTADQVRNRTHRLGLVRPNPYDRMAAAVTNERAKALKLAETRDMTKALKGQAQWEDFLDIVRGELIIPPLERPTIIPSAGNGTPETMVIMISDIHIGKLVQPSAVGSDFGYNAGLFFERGKELLASILRLRDIHSAHSPIPKLVLFFLGDGVDGVDMRRGHAHRVDMNAATQQVIELSRYFVWLLANLEPYFEDGIDLNWEFGNHGRVGDFGVNLPSDNWDYIAGVMVEQNLAAVPRVRVNVHTQKYGIYQIGPLVAYAAHGDMIKGGGGSPVVKRHIASVQNLHRRVFDLVLLGHFHNSEYLTAGGAKVFLNGAWDGGDDFSVNQLVAASDPAQWAFGVHPRRGVTWQYEINLAPRRASTAVTK